MEADGPQLSEFYAWAAELIREYLAEFQFEVARLAAVVNRYNEYDDPGLFLARHFCKERWDSAPLNRPENFELHAHKQYDMPGFRVNSWVRSKSANLNIPNERRRIILVEQDINTLPQLEVAYTDEQVLSFFGTVPVEFDTILKLYYPEEVAG